jgi:hypothetical protein
VSCGRLQRDWEVALVIMLIGERESAEARRRELVRVEER